VELKVATVSPTISAPSLVKKSMAFRTYRSREFRQ
jgi:hypothetical protein